MAATRSDVARRIADFEFACHAADVAFSEAYCMPSIPRPSIRDRGNPMELYDDQQFLARYRFSKSAVQRLLSMLPVRESRDNRGQPVPPMLELLMALRFYGAGTFQTVTGDLVRIPQSTVCRAVGKMTLLIAKHLRPMLVTVPDASQFRRVMREFYGVGGFPGVTGCIDCTHVRIKSPGGPNAEVFRNRKGYFSINVQAVAGPQLQFYDIVASWPGSVHDSRIFDNSRVRVLYEERRVPGLLLGDAGYACQPFLMTPLADPGPANTPRGRYNKAHIKTRNTIERAFGVWKRRFPCLDMGLQHRPEKAVIIITACAALHNLACLMRDPQPPNSLHAAAASSSTTIVSTSRPPYLPPIDSHSDSLTGMRARELLIQKSFC